MADDSVPRKKSGGLELLGPARRKSEFESPSRLEMIDSGVPDAYVDALLDENYMETLILANDHLNKKRKKRLERYLRMNKIIFGFLIFQAIMGILVALYKTVLQPDYVYNAQAELQNVDFMVMMDTAKHMAPNMALQHQVLTNFSKELNQSLEFYRQDTAIEIAANLTRTMEENAGFLTRWIPGMKYLTSGAAQASAEIHGGWLRIATGTFNAKESTTLHGFTRNLTVQKERLSRITEDQYQSSGRWLSAFEQCERMIGEAGHAKSLKFCVIIGDNEAMCRKHVGTQVSELCKQFPMLCPPGDDLDDMGNLIEYEEEMQHCTNFTRDRFQNSPNPKVHGTELIMMFTTKGTKDEQHRLAQGVFRRFIASSTNCSIVQNITKSIEVYNKSGKPSDFGKPWYNPQNTIENPNCLKFIMASSFEEMSEKAKQIARLLKHKSKLDQEDNAFKDYRYLFFLILPLNLLFFLIWTKILRCTMEVKKHAERKMGTKKKMIKVTKTLVEKPRRDSKIEDFEACLTEVEMGEVKSMRPVVGCGDSMTLRARLKGGYLRHEAGNLDGNGAAYDTNANWMFDAIDGSPNLQAGTRVKIRNAAGKVLRVDENGTCGFIDSINVKRGVAGTDGDEDLFVIEQLDYCEGDDGGPAHLGDTIRVKCCQTGKYIRVHKDGHTDGLGEQNDAETQLTIDMGGATLATNAVVTLKSLATDSHMFGDSEGFLSALPGGDTWKYWQIEKKEDAGDPESNATGAQASNAVLLTPVVSNLKVGDVITLRGINQHMLEVAQDGSTAHCGKVPLKTAPEDPDDADALAAALEAAQEPAGSGCQEFIIERIGMGTIRTHDNTIRNGAQICLRPKHGPNIVPGNAADCSNYLNVEGDGVITADGRVTTRAIGFTINLASMQDMVSPISEHLLKGDMELMISPLWNKSEIKRLEALSAPWTTEEDLSRFRGLVVVANEKGQYSVPKAKGESSKGWVAVIGDGCDISKAARQAKAQGATGLVIKTSEMLSMDKLARNTSQEEYELPAVYVDEGVARELNERGIELQGLEFKGQNRTAALRSIGRAGCRPDSKDPSMMKSKIANNTADVFKNVGALMVEKAQEEAEAEKRKREHPAVMGEVEVDEDDDGAGNGFQWKVAANTHYLWSTGGGGAAKMNVNFGKKAPPSAQKRHKVNIATGEVHAETDASQHHVLAQKVKSKKVQMELAEKRVSVVTVTTALIEAEELTNHNIGGFAGELDQVLTEEQMAAQPMEQLPEDSDFKIEYNFEEIEVAAGEKVEEIMEEELIDDSGTIVGRFAVPVARFWMVAGGMLASTLFLTLLLLILMKTADVTADRPESEPHESDQDLDNPDLPTPAPAVMLMASVWRGIQTTYASLRGSSVLDH